MGHTNHSRFDLERFTSRLQTSWLGREVEYFSELPSTNSYLKACPQDLTDGHLVITDMQHQGRGQYGREWYSEPHANLTFSILYHPHQIKRLQSLTMIVSLACARAIRNATGLDVRIKWPNDLLCNGSKMGGILIESAIIGNKIHKMVIGIGINVNQTEYPGLTGVLPTSIKQVLGQPDDVDRVELLAVICTELEHCLEEWDSGLPLPRSEIHELLIGFGKYGHLDVNGSVNENPVKFLGICDHGFPTFVTWDGDILRFRQEQVRFTPKS